MKPPNTFLIHLLMILCAVLVSGSFPVGAAITSSVDPAALTLIRFILASLLFAPIVWLRCGFAVTFFEFLRYSLVSLVLVIFFWCMFFSLRYTTALNTSAIFTLVPSLSGIYAIYLNGERLGKSRFIALFFGIIGALWIIFRGDTSLFLSLAWNRGDLIFLVGCLAMGLYTPLVRKFHRGEPMEKMAFWITCCGALWLLLPGSSQLNHLDFSTIRPVFWLGIFYLAFFSTIITFFLTQYCTLYIGPTRTMAYSYLYPGLVLIIDFVFRKEIPAMKVLPGVCIVLLAMLVVQSAAKQKIDLN